MLKLNAIRVPVKVSKISSMAVIARRCGHILRHLQIGILLTLSESVDTVTCFVAGSIPCCVLRRDLL